MYLVTFHRSFHYISVFEDTGCNSGELIHPVLSIHSRAMRTRLYTAESPSMQADMALPHRDAPTLPIHCTLANAKLQGAKCT